MKEYNGQWYISNQPDKKYSGILTIDKEISQLRLKLFSRENISSHINRKIVNGDSYLDKITILSCDAKNEREVTHELYTSEYLPHFTFIGCHFKTIEDIKFKSLLVDFDYLGRWLNPKDEDRYKLDLHNNGVITINSIKPKQFQVTLSSDCLLTFHTSFVPNGNHVSHFGIETQHFVEFNLSEHRPFEEFLSLTTKLKYLLTLFTAKPLSVTHRTGYSEKAINENDINSRLETSPVTIYLNKQSNEVVPIKYLHFSDIPVSTANFTQEEIGKMILSWFNKFDDYEPVYDIFFHAVNRFWKGGSFTLSNVEYNNAFLNIIQALEAYHRIKTNETEKDNTLFNLKKQTVIDGAQCLSQEDKEWLKQHVKPKKGKEFTLVERINELLKSDIFTEIFNGEADIAQNLVSWRDSLTHINHKKSKDVNVKGWFDKAQAIMVVNLFLDLGISKDKVQNIMLQTPIFRLK